jgi:hypothetical protein
MMNRPSAKNIVVSIIAADLMFTLILILIRWFLLSEAKDMDMARFFVHCVLCWFLFKGKNWARWVFVVLSALDGIMEIFLIIVGLQGWEKVLAFYVYTMSFVCLASAALLAFSKKVAGYFAASTLQADS